MKMLWLVDPLPGRGCVPFDRRTWMRSGDDRQDKKDTWQIQQSQLLTRARSATIAYFRARITCAWPPAWSLAVRSIPRSAKPLVGGWAPHPARARCMRAGCTLRRRYGCRWLAVGCLAANDAVAQDPAGNLKLAKDKSTERIDGIVAIIMAIGRAMLPQERRSAPSMRTATLCSCEAGPWHWANASAPPDLAIVGV